MAIDRDDYKPTALEQVAGHPAVGAGAVGVAAVGVAATGAAVFLPLLLNTLAARRHEERLQRFIRDVSAELEEFQEKLDDLSDAQYQLIGDAIACAQHTVSEDKLRYLRHAIRNSLDVDIDPAQSAYIARTIRDISPEEAELLLRTVSHQKVYTDAGHRENQEVFYIDPSSSDFLSLSGLTSLGLFRQTSGGFGGGYYVRNRTADVVYRLLTSEPF